MATVDDAIELLTDPALRAKGAKVRPRFVQMRGPDVIDELVRRGAADRGEARALAIEALDQLGGQTRTSFHQGGFRAGGKARQQADDEFWVPGDALREAS